MVCRGIPCSGFFAASRIDSIASSSDFKAGAKPPSSPTEVANPLDFKIEANAWNTSAHHLKHSLKEGGLATSVGDEGGFAPALKSDEEAIETILEAVKKAGYEPGKDFKIAMDAASSEWKSEKGKGYYKLPKAGTEPEDSFH